MKPRQNWSVFFCRCLWAWIQAFLAQMLLKNYKNELKIGSILIEKKNLIEKIETVLIH